MNHSQLSWALLVLHALSIRCEACREFAAAGGASIAPEEASAFPLRALVPDADGSDYTAFRAAVVRPYLRRSPQEFSPSRLVAALRSTRIGLAMLELCPQEYARW